MGYTDYYVVANGKYELVCAQWNNYDIMINFYKYMNPRHGVYCMLLWVECFAINNSLCSQTFRADFDRLENSAGANAGHGASFVSNVVYLTHNNETDYLNGYLAMFKATRDKRYLDRFIIHTKRVQERRNDNIKNLPSSQVAGFPAFNPATNCTISSSAIAIQIDDTQKGWSYNENNDCAYNDIDVLHIGTICYPMAEFIYLMTYDNEFSQYANEPVPSEANSNDNPSAIYFIPEINDFVNVTNYHEFAEWLTHRVKQSITYSNCFYDGGAYYNNCSSFTVSNRQYTNIQASMGRLLVMMYLVTGDNAMHSKITDLTNLFKGSVLHLNTNTSGYEWYYDDPDFNGTGSHYEDNSHAWTMIEFADICHTYDIRHYGNPGLKLFDATDMVRFANTFKNAIYRGPLDFAANVFGTDDVPAGGGGSPRFYTFLSKYDPVIYQMLADYNSEAAIYNSANSNLKLTSQLALYQHLFNPIAVQRNAFFGELPMSVSSGDFNGDGKPEFAAALFAPAPSGIAGVIKIGSVNIDASISHLATYSASGQPFFCTSNNFMASTGYDEIAAVREGNLMLFEAPSLSSVVPIGATYSAFAGNQIEAIASGELSSVNPGDEVVIANNTDGKIYILGHNGTGFFQLASFPVSSQIAGIAVGHFDNSVTGIAVADNSNNYISIYNAAGALLYSYTLAGYPWNGIAAGDFDGDGIDEIMAHRDYDGQFLVYKVKYGNNPSGALEYSDSEYFPVDQGNGVMCASRLGLDPSRDALISVRNSDGQLSVFNLEGHCPGFSIDNLTVDASYNLDPNTFSSNHPSISNVYKTDFHANNVLSVNNFRVQPGYDVDFVAGNKIVVTSGSSSSMAVSGSKFHAYIDPSFSCQTTLRVSQPPSPDPPVMEKSSLSNLQVKPSQLEVFPNPAQGAFTLVIDEKTGGANAILKMFDALGREVLVREIANARNLIDIQALPPGLYLVRVSSDTGEYISKIQVR